ncbi:MAG: 4-hydroxythreonine-4-phosphate dehydrogenase [Rhodothermaceae bacterium]|nr:MAG: 4-hydroxythreonine-4-phosphate dehydrogenase [Rhodothermaceae bacterium]
MMENETAYRDGPGRRPRLAITLGDPNGIGPEVVLRCLVDSRLMKYMQPVIIGSADVLRTHARVLGLSLPELQEVRDVPAHWPEDVLTVLDATEGESCPVEFGRVSAVAGRLSMRAVARAADLCLEGRVDAMVTAPISKEAINRAGIREPGHTEFIARRAGCERYTMMMVADRLRVGLVTGHVPIWDVPKLVTKEAILDKVDIISRSLSEDFGIARPRIAVLGLNPHAGDGGVMGREEIEVILPAVDEACNRGYLVFGPLAADGFFAVGAYRQYDAVLAMYHDQGLIPFKTLAFDAGVNFTAGLPLVRTSPDHGTAFDIAGQGKASPRSMRSAIFLAIDIARRRAAHRPRKTG